MAFPGTYNFSYYEGDTFEFKIYPKTSNGSAFSLSGFSASFNIAPVRGAAGVPNQVECLASIDSTNNVVTCIILPTQGRQLVAGTTYVYDVQVTHPTYKTVGSQIVPGVFTLLNGSITVTADISGAS